VRAARIREARGTFPDAEQEAIVADEELRQKIDELERELEELRREESHDSGRGPADQARIAHLEGEIEQAWDLIRQRGGRRDAGEDPDGASARPVETIENYEQ
jgi:uncharacterized protein involved in exopolysaccharide biosynthesis